MKVSDRELFGLLLKTIENLPGFSLEVRLIRERLAGEDEAAVAVREEREECAKVVEQFNGYSPRYGNHLTNCAAAIRARGDL